MTAGNPTGAILALLRHGDHPIGTLNHCPACGDDLTRVGVTSLAYTFEVCECGSPEYPHLVEQIWHREHLDTATAPSIRTAHLLEAAQLVTSKRSTIPTTAPQRYKAYTEIAAFLRRVARGAE